MRKYTKEKDISKNLREIAEILSSEEQPWDIVVGINVGNLRSEIYYVYIDYNNKKVYLHVDTLVGAKYIGKYLACHFNMSCYNEWDDEPYNISATIKKDVKEQKLQKMYQENLNEGA